MKTYMYIISLYPQNIIIFIKKKKTVVKIEKSHYKKRNSSHTL